MCIIIDNSGHRIIEPSVIDRSAIINSHGYGRFDLRTGKVIKTMDMQKAKRLAAEHIPAIHHFRFATAGATSKDMAHPFPVRDGWRLFMNGHVSGMSCSTGESDTARIAKMLAEGVHEDNFAKVLKHFDARFLMAHAEKGIIKTGNWHEVDGIGFSKDNVLPDQYLAVYGTLRKGFGNHHRMAGSSFIGMGKTKERHRMIGTGVPTVHEGDPDGKGGHIVVELYRVSYSSLTGPIDALEGHPRNYTRRKTVIVLDKDQSEVEAWLYFMDREPHNDDFYTDFAERHKKEKFRVVSHSVYGSDGDRGYGRGYDASYRSNSRPWELRFPNSVQHAKVRRAQQLMPCDTCGRPMDGSHDEWWVCDYCFNAKHKRS